MLECMFRSTEKAWENRMSTLTLLQFLPARARVRLHTLRGLPDERIAAVACSPEAVRAVVRVRTYTGRP